MQKTIHGLPALIGRTGLTVGSCTICFMVFLLGLGMAHGAAPGPFRTALTDAQLDPAAFAEWVDGAEKSLPASKIEAFGLWTQTSRPAWQGLKFGDSKTPGARHLRIGFKSAMKVGTVLVRGGGQLSVLKAGAIYPGNPANENEWLPAQRLRARQLVADEVGQEEFAVWVLPPGTETRALRFAHLAQPADKSYAGWFGGGFILDERFANLAPQSIAVASARSEAVEKLVNENNDGIWSAWDNGKEGGLDPISPQAPAWITLVWPKEVTLRGLSALWAGFSACDAQFYNGAADRHPREALESDWQSLGSFERVENLYPLVLGPNWLDFGRSVTTRAVRLRITKVVDESRAHGHLKGNTKQGKRVWLGELLALAPLDGAELVSAILPAADATESHPPIAIRFKLPEPGYVTLVIEDAQGKRVRNLLAETPFPAGEHTAWWDGMDDLQRDPEASRHGIYRIPERFVEPGSYRVRGLWRKAVNLRYEFSIYNAGTPAWETADHTGAWLANHTPPCSALFVPGERAPGGKPLVYLGSFVSEGGHGLAWVDLEGRKQGGVGWVGGTWTGAAFLARDDGPNALTNVAGYVAAPWSIETYADKAVDKRGEVRLTAVTRDGNKPIYRYIFSPSFATNRTKGGDNDWFGEVGGLAARDGYVAFSLTKLGQVILVDSRNTNRIFTNLVAEPKGLGFDTAGNLLVISGREVLRFDYGGQGMAEAWGTKKATRLINAGLDAPRQLTLDASDNLYISDRGNSHQVKVFSRAGKLLRSIGKAGAPKAGPYEPLHMNNPEGLTIDSLNRLWVTENDFQPKRVSVWTLDGQLVRTFYGPSEYGGGGTLDPFDKTKFYFHGMEFKLDWAKGTDQLVRVFWRPDTGEFKVPDAHYCNGHPERPFRVQGRRYLGNNDNCNPTGGPGIATVWIDDGVVARPVAALGRAHDWKLLATPEFKALWPQGVDPAGDRWRNPALFAWSDLNGDGQVQPNEVSMVKRSCGSVNIMSDLSFAVSRVENQAMRFAPVRFTDKGVPVYDLASGEVLARDAQGPTSSGGDQALWHENGWTILTTPPKPYSPMSLGGVFKGEPMWSYPNPWPGLHASHESPAPTFPGQVIGTTRLLGGFVTPKGSDAGPLWCINGNQGNMYLFTVDGLFVAEFFRDVRRGPLWAMPTAVRGMELNDLTLHDENFWPTITQTEDGLVYLVDGAKTSLVRVDGLETIRRLPENTITLKLEDLNKARAYFVEVETERQKTRGRGVLKVPIRSEPPVVDGRLDDWSGVEWVDIDKSGVAAYFNSDSKPHNVTAAAMIAGDKLYVAWRADDDQLLRNSGEQPTALFKTGGALDLMLGTDPQAEDRRSKPARGDVRLLITRVKDKPMAVLYRAVVPGTTEPVPFSSPWRTITLDKVEEVSAAIQLASSAEKDQQGKVKTADYEVAIPLSLLGLKPAPGLSLRGDIGILRGNGFQTRQRVYWSNKATGITADVPSEAELTPQLWGRWRFE